MKKIMLLKSVVLSVSLLSLTSVMAGWQCNTMNAKNQTWVGTAATRAQASANAMKFCSAHSTYSRNCHITRCFRN